MHLQRLEQYLAHCQLCITVSFLIQCVCVLNHSVFSNSVILWTVACQVPLSMEFSRQEYWNGLPVSTPEDLLDPGIEDVSLTSLALAGGFFYCYATLEVPLLQ